MADSDPRGGPRGAFASWFASNSRVHPPSFRRCQDDFAKRFLPTVGRPSQLRLASFRMASLRRDLHPQDNAHAGRTNEKDPKAGFGSFVWAEPTARSKSVTPCVDKVRPNRNVILRRRRPAFAWQWNTRARLQTHRVSLRAPSDQSLADHPELRRPKPPWIHPPHLLPGLEV